MAFSMCTSGNVFVVHNYRDIYRTPLISRKVHNKIKPNSFLLGAARKFSGLDNIRFSKPRTKILMEYSHETTSVTDDSISRFSDVSSTASSASNETLSLELFEKDLLIVGPGVLGTLVSKLWAKEFPDSKIYGLTRTDNRHSELTQLGIYPLMKDSETLNLAKFPFVLFCAPPYGNDDYVGEVRGAAEKWNGVGSLLFTSSSALYDVSDNGLCDENSPVIAKGISPRVDRLIDAEEEVLNVEGNVVRLAGLYLLDRGAHTYWLRQKSVNQRPDHYLNLIHYEDAASLCVTILKARTRKCVFMGCDNHAVTRQELMDLVSQSGKFEGEEFEGFTATDGPLGKRMRNDATRAILNWHPKYKSFASFLESSS